MKFTKSSKKLLAALIGAGALCVSASSNAAFISNPDVTSGNFGGFDWNSAANAVATSPTGFVVGATVTTTYWATAIALQSVGGPNFVTPNMNGAALGSYEYTVLATITETLTCPPTVVGPCPGTGIFTATGGTYRIWYDETYDTGGTVKGNLVTGAGITDGTLIASGVIAPGFAGSFTPSSATSGLGIFGFGGSVATPSPLLFASATASNASSTLQLGTFTTAWTQATGMPGAGGTSVALPAGCPAAPIAIAPTCIIFQADANQSFVPEPGTMALAGLGLLMAGWRRRKS